MLMAPGKRQYAANGGGNAVSPNRRTQDERGKAFDLHTRRVGRVKTGMNHDDPKAEEVWQAEQAWVAGMAKRAARNRIGDALVSNYGIGF
ncbi:hypothetical protein [Trinickia dinghuensis]|uniref:hypothetical protein n=1 Tax=Trinickia dinghuensis TaxID=2291023 RepID=UPI0015F1AF97|nr:hypothetical protein [Trinickia dinghuensis]